jgi:excisionase family DNA binding protein
MVRMPNLHFSFRDLEPSARNQLAKLAGLAKGRVSIRVQAVGKAELKLPASAAGLVLRLAREMAAGRSFLLVPDEEPITTQEAAEVLGMSRQYLVQMLEEGSLPYHKNGTHRRLRLRDVKAFATKRDQERRRRLNKLFGGLRKSGKYE